MNRTNKKYEAHMKQHTILFGIAMLLLSACADDEEPRISHLNATTVNPDVHLYIEDFGEGDLLAAGQPVARAVHGVESAALRADA